MQRLLMAFAVTLILPGTAFAQDWMEYKSSADRFSVAFPGEPAVESTTYTSEYEGVFPARVYSRVTAGGRYSVTVVDYTDAESIHRERVKSCPEDAQSECAGSEGTIGIGSWKYDLLAAVDNATAAFLTRDARVTHFAWSVIDRVQGRQIHLTNPDGSREFVAIHMHDNRVYILDAAVPVGAPEPGLFQQSLQFLDEDGEVVRYETVYVPGAPTPSLRVR